MTPDELRRLVKDLELLGVQLLEAERQLAVLRRRVNDVMRDVRVEWTEAVQCSE